MKLLLIAATILVIVGVGAAIFLTQTTDGKRMWAGTKDGVVLLLDAKKAPGTQALRKLGCDLAMVMPMDRLMKVVEQMVPDTQIDQGAKAQASDRH